MKFLSKNLLKILLFGMLVANQSCYAMDFDDDSESSDDSEFNTTTQIDSQDLKQRCEPENPALKLQYNGRVFDPKYDWIGDKEFKLEQIHKMRPGQLGTKLEPHKIADQVFDESFDGFQNMDPMFRFFCEKFSTIMDEYQKNLDNNQDYNTFEDYVDHLITRMVIYLTDNLGERPKLFKYSEAFHKRWCYLFVYLENEALKYGNNFKDIFPASYLNRYLFKQHKDEANIGSEELYKPIEWFKSFFNVGKIKF